MSTDIFSVDKLEKCRTRSGSASSGNGGGASASNSAGSNSPQGRCGTSQAGNRTARRPGLDNSNNRSVDLVLRTACSLHQPEALARLFVLFFRDLGVRTTCRRFLSLPFFREPLENEGPSDKRKKERKR